MEALPTLTAVGLQNKGVMMMQATSAIAPYAQGYRVCIPFQDPSIHQNFLHPLGARCPRARRRLRPAS